MKKNIVAVQNIIRRRFQHYSGGAKFLYISTEIMDYWTPAWRNGVVEWILWMWYKLCPPWTKPRSSATLNLWLIHVSQTIQGRNVRCRLEEVLLFPSEVHSIVIIIGMERFSRVQVWELFLRCSVWDVRVFGRLPRAFAFAGPLRKLETSHMSLTPVPNYKTCQGETKQGQQSNCHLQTSHPVCVALILRGQRVLGAGQWHHTWYSCMLSLNRVWRMYGFIPSSTTQNSWVQL